MVEKSFMTTVTGFLHELRIPSAVGLTTFVEMS